VAQAWADNSCQPATRSSSPILDTTPTSCPGSSSAQDRARLLVAPVNDRASDPRCLRQAALSRTKMVALTQVSTPWAPSRPRSRWWHGSRRGACTLSTARRPWPISRECPGARHDFYVFSGHKIYAPTGIGRCTASPSAGLHPPCRRRQHDQGRNLARTPLIKSASKRKGKCGDK